MSVEALELSQILHIAIGKAEDLLQKRDVLNATLSALQDILITEGKASESHTAIQFENQKTLIGSLILAIKQAKKKQEEVDKLDVSRPIERLEAIGTPSIQQAEWTDIKVNPKFKFNLTTTHPIRAVNFTYGKSSKEKSQIWTPGGTTFKAELKNRRLNNASASVELYGWPKEIHHEELLQKQKELAVLTENCDRLQQQVNSGHADLEKLKSTNNAYEKAVFQCSRDLLQVQSLPALRSIDSQRLALYIACGSIYGLAILLNIKSMVPTKSPLVQNEDKTLIWPLLHGQRDMLARMQEHVKDVLSLVNEIVLKKFITEGRFQQVARTSLTDRLFFDPDQADFDGAQRGIALTPLDMNDDEKKTLAQKSLDAITKLQTDLEGFQRKEETLFARSHEERLRAFGEWNCQAETEETRRELELDWSANQEVISLLSAYKFHVGILATLNDTETTPDAIGRIWRIERLRLSERLTQISGHPTIVI